MKYTFIKYPSKEIFISNSLKKDIGLSWGDFNYKSIGFRGIMRKEEKRFLDDIGFKPTIFNVFCLRRLNKVYIPEGKRKYFIELKGGLKC